MFVTVTTYLDALFLLLGDNSDRSRTLVKEFLTATAGDARKAITGPDDNLVEAYRSLIKTVIAENITQDNQSAAKMLLLKIKSYEAFKDHPVEKDLLTDVLTAQEPVTAQQIDRYLKRLRNIVLQAHIDDVGRKLFAQSRKVGTIEDVDEQEGELVKIKALLDDSIRTIETKQNVSDNKASDTYVSLSDRESITRALNVYMERSVQGVLTTGLQGLNRALGERGGVGLGESIVFAADSHNYKSGMLVSMMLWGIIYNKLKAPDGKRLMVYFVSLENEVNQNLVQVFKVLYNRIEKPEVPVNPATMSVEFITDWLQNYFGQFNIELLIDRYKPHEFSFGKFVQRYNSFVEQGYVILEFVLDYLSEAKAIDPGDTMSAQGQIQHIKENYLKFMNHAKGDGYTFATGHQLTKKASELRIHRHAVKKFGPTLMADSSDVFRIVDCVCFIQLEDNSEGHKFLTARVAKNRGNQDTLEQHKFFAYPFTPFGILDDIDTLPGFVTDIDDWNAGQGAREEDIVDGAMF